MTPDPKEMKGEPGRETREGDFSWTLDVHRPRRKGGPRLTFRRRIGSDGFRYKEREGRSEDGGAEVDEHGSLR